MGALKNHPDWPEYLKKCYALRDEQIAIMDKIKAQYPPSGRHQQDSAADAACRPIERQFNAKLRQLQQEYSYLFPKSDERDEKEGNTS